MSSTRYPPICAIKIPLIIFWLLDTFIVPFIPKLEFFINRIKYKYYKTPKQQIVKLFDGYAESFEDHLVNTLLYYTPQHLTKFIHSNAAFSTTVKNVLDLGCGTGLLGQELRKQFDIERLIGIDLSWEMLKQSKTKGVYQELHNADLLEFLINKRISYDLIVSSDVFIYIGELKSIMIEAHKRLSVDGYFTFSVERQTTGTYKLTSSGRFVHSLRYLQNLAKITGFKNFKSQIIDLRKEYNNTVPGYIILLQK